MEQSTEVTLTKSELRIVRAAVADYRDMLTECLRDETLKEDEFQSFRFDSEVTEHLIESLEARSTDLGWS